MIDITKYPNARKATEKAILDYGLNKKTVASCKEKIRGIQERMLTPRQSVIDGLPHARDFHSYENRLISALDEKVFWETRCKKADTFLKWFEIAWNKLTAKERDVLSQFYLSDNNKGDKPIILAKKYNVEPNSVYRRKNRALDKLSTLLFGDTAP